MISLLGATGYYINTSLVYVARLTGLGFSTVYWLIAPYRGKGKVRYVATLEQMVSAGVQSLPIAGLIQFLVGMILALQLAYYLRGLSPESFVPGIIGVAATREIGPLLLAIVLAARVGASITAEIGTMVVSEEIIALETMALNPVSYLVVPRFIGLVFMAPFMTILIDLVGMLGGYAISAAVLDMSWRAYVDKTIDALVTKDLVTGIVKGTAFAAIVVLVGCYEGLSVERGAEGVGRNTMRSVVNSIVLIILTDLVFTLYFYLAD